MPEIQKELDGRYAQEKVEALAISTGDPDWYLREFKKQLNVTMPWLMMDTRLPNPYYQEQFDLWGLVEEHPTLVVLDAHGVVRYRAAGQGGVGPDQIDYRYAFDLIGTLIQEAKAAPAVEVGGQVGNQAPDFTLKDIYGEEVHLADYLGQVVVLGFFDSEQSVCSTILPELSEADQTYGDAVVLGIDVRAEPFYDVDDTIRVFGINFPLLIHSEEVAIAYDMINTGAILIDREGIIRARTFASIGKEFLALLTELLKE